MHFISKLDLTGSLGYLFSYVDLVKRGDNYWDTGGVNIVIIGTAHLLTELTATVTTEKSSTWDFYYGNGRFEMGTKDVAYKFLIKQPINILTTTLTGLSMRVRNEQFDPTKDSYLKYYEKIANPTSVICRGSKTILIYIDRVLINPVALTIGEVSPKQQWLRERYLELEKTDPNDIRNVLNLNWRVYNELSD